jgi:hypothetical protein
VFTKRQFIGVVLTFVFAQGSLGLVKMWAARHATHDGIDGTIASGVQVAL